MRIIIPALFVYEHLACLPIHKLTHWTYPYCAVTQVVTVFVDNST